MGPPSDRQTHLEILSELSKIALNADRLDQLRSASSADELFEQLKAISAEPDTQFPPLF